MQKNNRMNQKKELKKYGEYRGFKFNLSLKGVGGNSGNFDFASSNEL